MIAIVVPAHNEAPSIGACLASLRAAIAHRGLAGEPVEIFVVLDACTDDTGRIAAALGAHLVAVDARNVGVARSRGTEAALRAGARWLAFTDADSTVAPDWLHHQMAAGTDAVCGLVSIDDWSDFGENMAHHFAATYDTQEGHRHVHGANLGVSARAYRRAGGFAPLESHEDVALVEALVKTGASIAWSAASRVVTSARRGYKAPAGFGARLAQIERTKTWVLPAGVADERAA